MKTVAAKQYTHLELDREIEALSGHYTPQKEVRLPDSGGEVLYVIGHALIDAACCGEASYQYALIPGRIVRWQAGKNQDGLPVTEVTPVSDEAARERIKQAIKEREKVFLFEFW